MNSASPFDPANPLAGVRVLDGGLATELEAAGANISGTLWSAHVLEEEPEKLKSVHRAYVQAGAQVLATCSYQVSRMSYVEAGLNADRADQALMRSIRLAREVVAEFPEERVLVAASLGPYGAALHNGAEYTGHYDCSFSDLVRFHRERLEVLALLAGSNAPDLLAFETFPSLEEARAVAAALEPFPHLRAWFSFSCRNGQLTSHGEPVAEVAAFLNQLPQAVAVGVNCIPARHVSSLIAELRQGTSKSILVYPNSGEGWDAVNRCWSGVTPVADFQAQATSWFSQGASIVGGCCRIGPSHIAQVARAAQTQFAPQSSAP